MTYDDPHAALLSVANPEKSAVLRRFFKTGKGDYGEGDQFIGVMIPFIRKLSKQFSELPLTDVQKLLRSPYNEERLLALFILIHQFQKGDDMEKEKIYRLYLKHLRYVNNWNLVDCSAPYLLGPYLIHRSRTLLYKLARSKNLWERRIAIMSTFYFIRQGEFNDALELTRVLLKDKHDLMHKACGWMLREIGKRNAKILETFLKEHYQEMPRTMLRYAIERFPEQKRLAYLYGRVN